jgi:hypothetical protein
MRAQKTVIRQPPAKFGVIRGTRRCPFQPWFVRCTRMFNGLSNNDIGRISQAKRAVIDVLSARHPVRKHDIQLGVQRLSRGS